MREIKLGSKVQCKYTGFIGYAITRTEFINGCIQYGVVGKVGKDNKEAGEADMDVQSLTVLEEPEEDEEGEEPTGGPTRKFTKMKGY